MVNKSIISAACACLAVISFSANAALIGRLEATPGVGDYQAYYDDVADLTWLADANANGLMNWSDANAWAAGLDVAGVTGWRLAVTYDSDDGWTSTGSEMSDLFYNALGNAAGSLTNTGPFSNVQTEWYWSATRFMPMDDYAWAFHMGEGFQEEMAKSILMPAWAVHSGDVIPIPAAVWLFGSGLLGLIGVARSKRQS